MRTALQRLAILALVFGFGVLIGAIWQPKWRIVASSFDECLLNEMRGQSKELTVVAGRLCRSRFPVAPLSQKSSTINLRLLDDEETKGIFPPE